MSIGWWIAIAVVVILVIVVALAMLAYPKDNSF
jgi:hypothetical protein